MTDLTDALELAPLLRRGIRARVGRVGHAQIAAQHSDADLLGLPVLLPVICQPRHGVYPGKLHGRWFVTAQLVSSRGEPLVQRLDVLLYERLFQRVTLLVEILDRANQSGADSDECDAGGDDRGYDRSVHELYETRRASLCPLRSKVYFLSSLLLGWLYAQRAPGSSASAAMRPCRSASRPHITGASAFGCHAQEVLASAEIFGVLEAGGAAFRWRTSHKQGCDSSLSYLRGRVVVCRMAAPSRSSTTAGCGT